MCFCERLRGEFRKLKYALNLAPVVCLTLISSNRKKPGRSCSISVPTPPLFFSYIHHFTLKVPAQAQVKYVLYFFSTCLVHLLVLFPFQHHFLQLLMLRAQATFVSVNQQQVKRGKKISYK